MKETEIQARALVLKFMMPVDPLRKYPMCFDTAKQCAIICITEVIALVIERDYEDVDRLQEITKIIENLSA